LRRLEREAYRDDKWYAAYAPVAEDLAVVVHAPSEPAIERFGDEGASSRSAGKPAERDSDRSDPEWTGF
jgi:hypothetical protein